MSFWSDIGSAIAAEVKVVEADALKFAQFLKPLVEASAAELGQAAISAVLQQAPALISGTEKMSNAIASVKVTLASAGKTAALSVINATIQEAHDQLSAAAHPAVTN